ncbi:MAG: mechanosensitive ion channel family protein [Planctomycetota bacterium]|jgi:MscS family membrane protein
MIGEMVLGSWTDLFTETKYMYNELWRWVGLFGLLLGALIGGKIISFMLQRQAQRLEQVQRAQLLGKLLKALAGPIALILLAAALYIAGTFIFVPQAVEKLPDQEQSTTRLVKLADVGFWVNLCKMLTVLAAGWFIFRLVDIIEHFLLKWTSKTDTALDDQLVPLIRKTLRVFVVIVVFLFIAQNIFKWDIGSLIAGLGIGGLAVALAAKDTLSNLFGSVTIFSDRPFHLGDRIKVAGHDGFIEEVGVRSTRIRTLTGHQVIVPNSVVANEPVENIGRRPYIKRVLDVTVTYDTPPNKIERGIEILREMFEARTEHFPDDFPPRVYFNDFNPASLNIVVYYWFTPPDWWEYLEFNHDFNMELLRRFNAEGIEFAFPTQTLYVKQEAAKTIRKKSVRKKTKKAKRRKAH